jgi:hypothetical protein
VAAGVLADDAAASHTTRVRVATIHPESRAAPMTTTRVPRGLALLALVIATAVYWSPDATTAAVPQIGSQPLTGVVLHFRVIEETAEQRSQIPTVWYDERGLRIRDEIEDDDGEVVKITVQDGLTVQHFRPGGRVIEERFSPANGGLHIAHQFFGYRYAVLHDALGHPARPELEEYRQRGRRGNAIVVGADSVDTVELVVDADSLLPINQSLDGHAVTFRYIDWRLVPTDVLSASLFIIDVDAPVESRAAITLPELQATTPFSVYYLGSQFQGVVVSGAQMDERSDTGHMQARISYGDDDLSHAVYVTTRRVQGQPQESVEGGAPATIDRSKATFRVGDGGRVNVELVGRGLDVRISAPDERTAQIALSSLRLLPRTASD